MARRPNRKNPTPTTDSATSGKVPGTLGEGEGAHADGWRAIGRTRDRRAQAGICREMLEAGALVVAGAPERTTELISITHWYWDHVGYGDDLPQRIWEAWLAAYEGEKPNGKLMLGLSRLAWHHACRGEKEPLHAMMRRVLAPGFLPDRVDLADQGTVFFDAFCHAGYWSGDEAMAKEGVDAYAIIAAKLPYPPMQNADFVAMKLEGVARFGWERDPAWWQTYREMGRAVRGGVRRDIVGLRAIAVIAAVEKHLDEAIEAYDRIAVLAWKGEIGFEWTIEAGIESARRCGEAGRIIDAQEHLRHSFVLTERYGLGVFLPAIEKLQAALPALH